VLLLLQTW